MLESDIVGSSRNGKTSNEGEDSGTLERRVTAFSKWIAPEAETRDAIDEQS